MRIVILLCLLIIGCDLPQKKYPIGSRVKIEGGITATVQWADVSGYRVTYIDKIGQRHEAYVYKSEIYQNNQ